MKFPKHYSLKKEDTHHYEIHDSRDDKSFKVSKHHLDLEGHVALSKLPKYQEGGEVAQDQGPDKYQKTYEDLKKHYETFTPGEPAIARERMALEGATRAKEMDVNKAAGAALEAQQQQVHVDKLNEQRAQLGLPPMPGGTPPQQELQPTQPQGQAVPVQATQEQPPIDQTGGIPVAGDLTKLEAQQSQALKSEAMHRGQQLEQEAKIRQDQANAMQTAQTEFHNNMQEIDKSNESLKQDILSGKENPDRYWQNLSTGSKIGTLISVILGGAASGAYGGRNVGLEQFNKYRDDDIAAQRTDLNRKQNLLSENLRRQGNLISAEAATRLQMSAIFEAKLAQNAAATGNPILMDLANQKIAELKQHNLKDKMTLAQNQLQLNLMRNMNSPAAQKNPDQLLNLMRVVNPERAKEMQERYVPGVGFASRPVSETVLGQISSRNSLQHGIEKLEAFAKQHEGSFDPRVMVEGKTLAKQVQDMYRRANQQGVFKESEKDFVEGIVTTDPTKFLAKYRTLPMIKSLREMNQGELNSIYEAHGLPTKNVEEQEVKTYKGVQYQKVSGGWQRVK